MLIIIILFAAALGTQTFYLFYYKRQIKDIGNQLDFISTHHSFKFIQSQVKPREVSRLIDYCNSMLRNNRELNQEFIYKSEEINATIMSLSHDIRTPITSLDGYLQLAKRAGNDEEKTTYIQLAESRIKQINTLVDELFLYTKLQNPDYELETEPTAITNVLKKCLFSFIDDFTQEETEPALQLLKSSPIIEANENALERIFENIIKNYFIHGKETLSIQEEVSEGKYTLQFTNLMKDHHQLQTAEIFTTFYKEDSSRTKHSSGLGLSIVESLMEKMNGTVQAASEKQEFRIWLIFDYGEGREWDDK